MDVHPPVVELEYTRLHRHCKLVDSIHVCRVFHVGLNGTVSTTRYASLQGEGLRGTIGQEIKAC